MRLKEDPPVEADQETEEIVQELEAATKLMKAWPDWKRPVLGWWSNRESSAPECDNTDNGHLVEPVT
jgi:hypothetical protein